MSKNPNRCYDDLALGLITKWDFAEQRVLERLSMYERRFEASLFRTMAELKKLQYARKLAPSETAETEAVSYRRRDARETQGRDALATEEQRQYAKQSQSSGAKEELSSFEKREYELLTHIAPGSNKANDPQWKAGIRDRKAENRQRRQAGVCRY